MADCGVVSSELLHGVLIARADGAPPLPFDPERLVLLVVWVYLCMYSVHRVQLHELIKKKYRPVVSILALLVGPALLAVLFVAQAARISRLQRKSFWGMLQKQSLHAFNAIRQEYGKGRPSALRLLDSSGRSMDEIYGHSGSKKGDARILNLTEEVIASALDRRASDILIDPADGETCTVRLRIDGALTLFKEIDARTSQAVINSIKAVSGMDISDRRRPQDGGFSARRGDIVASFRVASAGALNGEKLSVRVLNKDAATLTLAALGLDGQQCDTIAKTIKRPSGMILLCGPTGSGKTTTMYAMINQIDRLTRNVITVEDPIEAVLPQTSQIEINPKADITFAKTLRSVLRQDPDVICVGEIRDEETAEIALRASQTGHLVLATLHCDSNASALIRLLDLGVSPLLLSSGLNLLVSQRLLRRLCDHCKKPAKLTDSQVLGFHRKGFDLSNVFTAGRCRHCDQTGYHGRIAIGELLVVDDELKDRIARNDDFIGHVQAAGHKKSQPSLRRSGMQKVTEGITSLEELKRVVG